MQTILTFLRQIDKQLHIAFSSSICFTLGLLIVLLPFAWMTLPISVAIAAAITLAGGFYEEWRDSKQPLIHSASWLDILADSIGIAAASLVLLAPMIVTFLKAQA